MKGEGEHNFLAIYKTRERPFPGGAVFPRARCESCDDELWGMRLQIYTICGTTKKGSRRFCVLCVGDDNEWRATFCVLGLVTKVGPPSWDGY